MNNFSMLTPDHWRVLAIIAARFNPTIETNAVAVEDFNFTYKLSDLGLIVMSEDGWYHITPDGIRALAQLAADGAEALDSLHKIAERMGVDATKLGPGALHLAIIADWIDQGEAYNGLLDTRPVAKERQTFNSSDDDLPNNYYCPKCGEAWAVHNDDGSCVDDDFEAKKASAEARADFWVNNATMNDSDERDRLYVERFGHRPEDDDPRTGDDVALFVIALGRKLRNQVPDVGSVSRERIQVVYPDSVDPMDDSDEGDDLLNLL